MKKIIAITSGSFLIAACLITPLSNASSLAYHNYIFKSQLTKKNKRFAQGRRTTKMARSQKLMSEKKSPLRNYRYPVTGKRNLYEKESKQNKKETSTKYFYFEIEEKTVSENKNKNQSWAFNQRKKVPKLNINKKINISQQLKTHNNKEYTIQLPYQVTEYEKDFFYSRNMGLSFTIKHIESCKSVGFSACAINASRNENHISTRNKISNISQIKRQLSMSDSMKNEISIQTPTLTETFEGVYLGNENFISRHFIADGIGGMYLIDAQTKKENSGRDLETIKKVFDSFRII